MARRRRRGVRFGDAWHQGRANPDAELKKQGFCLAKIEPGYGSEIRWQVNTVNGEPIDEGKAPTRAEAKRRAGHALNDPSCKL